MDKRLAGELDTVLKRVASAHDVIPFMDQLEPSAEIAFRPLPNEILKILQASPDYRSVRPGAAPTWFQVTATDSGMLELIVYRSEVDGGHYVIAPREGS